MSSVAHKHTRSLEVIQQVDPPRTQDTREMREEHEGRDLVSYLSTSVYAGFCHGSTGSPSALSEEGSKRGVTVLEGARVLARGTRSCT